MGLPYAPNSVPLGMNPGGKRLTTRIHNFPIVLAQCMLLAPNPMRLSAFITSDAYFGNASAEISIDPDDQNSWCLPMISYSGFHIYGGMAIYARVKQGLEAQPGNLIVFEYIYE